jgi:hypothetical protein
VADVDAVGLGAGAEAGAAAVDVAAGWAGCASATPLESASDRTIPQVRCSLISDSLWAYGANLSPRY